jgi:hypothetical protein
MSGNQFEPRHLRGILEREARAERALAEAEARALLEIGSDHVAVYTPRATLTPKVGRAWRKVTEARVERTMAEHLLADHLRDEASS